MNADQQGQHIQGDQTNIAGDQHNTTTIETVVFTPSGRFSPFFFIVFVLILALFVSGGIYSLITFRQPNQDSVTPNPTLDDLLRVNATTAFNRHCIFHQLNILVRNTPIQDDTVRTTSACKIIAVKFDQLPHPITMQICFPQWSNWCGAYEGEDHWLNTSSKGGKDHWVTFHTPNQWEALTTPDIVTGTDFYLIFKSVASYQLTMELAYG